MYANPANAAPKRHRGLREALSGLVMGVFAILAVSCTVDNEPPAVPEKPVVTEVSPTSVSLELTHNGDDVEVVGYKLYRNTTNDFSTAIETDLYFGDGSASIDYTDPAVTPATTYYYWLKAYDASGKVSFRSGAQQVQTGSAADSERPAVPMKPVVTATSSTSITLDLTHNGDNVAVVGYKLYRNTTNNFTSALESDVYFGDGAATTMYIDEGLVSGTTYFYWLKAYDASGNQSYRSGERETETDGSCGDNGTITGRWHTQEVCGVWHLVKPTGEVAHWNAVNVRGHSLVDHELDNADVANLAMRFDQARLNLKWDQIQPQQGVLSSTNPHLVAAKAFLDDAANNGVEVILDPVHLGGSDSRDVFGIPEWAWIQAGYPNPADRAPNKSYTAWAGANNDAVRVRDYLSALNAAGVLTHPAVIAVEVVNEPHPRNGNVTLEATQSELMDAYAALIEEIRYHDADMVAVVGAYYGGTRHGGAPDGDGFAHNAAYNRLTDQDHENIVWTAHSYFTGVGDTIGVINDGQKASGERDGGLWAEGSKSAGCYTRDQANNPTSAWSCPPVAAGDRATAQAGSRANAEGHWRYAQEASMPFFLGEWGVGRQRVQANEYRGWDNAHLLFCDKINAYEDIDGQGTSISWAAWSFDAAADAFGLYNSRDGVDQGNAAKNYLISNAWVDAGSFPNNPDQGAWGGQPWEYASAFAPGVC